MSNRHRRDILVQTFKAFLDDKVSQKGASLAYYTVFALPPILILLLMFLGHMYGSAAAQRTLMVQLQAYMGKAGMDAIKMMLEHLNAPDQSNFFTASTSILVLVFTSTGAFVQLQDALNTVWGVQLKPSVGWTKMVINRLVSFLMIISLALLSLLTVVLDFVLAVIQNVMTTYWDSDLYVSLFKLFSFVLSMLFMAVLFAVLFKTLPDVKVTWKNVFAGGMFTSMLFTLGKVAMSLYLSFSNLGSAYGAAGSMMVLLFWIFLSMQIVLVGAEYTWSYAFYQGHRIQPADYAMWLPGYEKRIQALEEMLGEPDTEENNGD